jgi:hypothetical protein
MWEPRRLTTLWTSTACYRDNIWVQVNVGSDCRRYMNWSFRGDTMQLSHLGRWASQCGAGVRLLKAGWMGSNMTSVDVRQLSTISILVQDITEGLTQLPYSSVCRTAGEWSVWIWKVLRPAISTQDPLVFLCLETNAAMVHKFINKN